MSNENSNDKPSNSQLSPECQPKRPKTEVSSPIEIIAKSDESDRTLPGYVAGTSPAKFITITRLQEIGNELANMAIAHEIAFNPEFTVEQLKQRTTCELAQMVEDIAVKAFYDSIRDNLNSDPPKYEPVFHLYGELKTMAMETVTPQASKIFEQIDVDEPRRQHEQNCLDMRGLLVHFLDLLSEVCAPVRDEEIRLLRDETDIVELFRGIHRLLINMKNDMVNFTIRQSRHYFLQHSAKFENEKFMKVLELFPNAADLTEVWLSEALDEYLKRKDSPPDAITESDLRIVMSIAYARLLETKRDDSAFPEILIYDTGRVAKLIDERLRLSLILCGVFIASNFAGKDVCEKTDFKQTLKTNLVAILQDATKSNYKYHLQNVYLECDKQLKTVAKSTWNESHSTLLKSQIEALENQDNSIRKIVDERIFTIVSEVLQGPQAMSSEGAKLPPGLSLIELELISMISSYLSVTIYNMKGFGAFYLKKVNEILQARLKS